MKKILKICLPIFIICLFCNIVYAENVSFNFREELADDTFFAGEIILEEQTIDNLQKIKELTTIASFKQHEAEKIRIEQEKNSKTVINATENELDMLAKIIYAEARGESYNGKVAVGAVIMNRIKSSKYPNTIRDVIFAPKQFSPVSNGTYYSAKPGEAEYQAAKDALNGVDPTNGALTFYAYTYTYSAYHESMHHTATIGNHKFFR